MSTNSHEVDNSHKYLSEGELQKLLTAIDDLEDKTLVLFALETGLRRSELVTIRTADIDFDRQTVKVYDEKKDEWRLAVFPNYVGTQLRMYLEARRERSPLAFPFSHRTATGSCSGGAQLSASASTLKAILR
jgi:integrase